MLFQFQEINYQNIDVSGPTIVMDPSLSYGLFPFILSLFLYLNAKERCIDMKSPWSINPNKLK
jgi:hypothetical protein